jgi:hypothetical protein
VSRSLRFVVAVLAALVAAPATAVAAPGDVARYILPPGNYGGLPTTDESRDQLPLYDGLTAPAVGATSRAPTSTASTSGELQPVGADPRGGDRPSGPSRSSTTATACPTSPGRTRYDWPSAPVWVTARDRGLLIQVGRGPARARLSADIPGIDAFSLVTSASLRPAPSPE